MSRNGSRTLLAASIGACQEFKVLERQLMRVRLSPATLKRLADNQAKSDRTNQTRKQHHG